MKFYTIAFLLLFSCMYLSLAQGSYDNCCLRYVKKIAEKVKKNIVSYRMQETDGSCNLSAVVFEMKKRGTQTKPRLVCANPTEKWVQDEMIKVDRKARSKAP